MVQLINKFRLWPVFLLVILQLTACDSTDSSEDVLGDWTRSVPYQGNPRSGAVSFLANEQAFAGLGYDGEDYLKDFYYFDAGLGYWTETTAFPGTGREKAVAFTLGGQGYVGLGYNRDELTEELGDFWRYNPATSEWTQLNDFPGGKRYGSVAFVVNGSAYVGTGNDGSKNLSDVYKYLPDTDTWVKIAGYPGEKLENAMAFTSGAKAYLFGGRNNGLYNAVLWEFDPSLNKWTDLSKDDSESDYEIFLDATSRTDAGVVVGEDRVFVMGGTAANTVSRECFEYQVTDNVWVRKTDLEASARHSAVSFGLDGRYFIGLGQSGTSYFDDVWEFHPDEDYDSSK